MPALCGGTASSDGWNGDYPRVVEAFRADFRCTATRVCVVSQLSSPAICHLAKSNEEVGPLLRVPPTAGVQRATTQAGPGAPTTLAVQESPFSGIGLGLRSSHSVLMVAVGWRRGIQHRSRYEVLVSGRVDGMPLAPRRDLASSDVWLWRKLRSKNDVRGKVDLDFWIAAIRSKCDERRETIPSALIQASPTINVAFQDGSVLFWREWPLLVATLAFVVREPCRKNCGLSRSQSLSGLLRASRVSRCVG